MFKIAIRLQNPIISQTLSNSFYNLNIMLKLGKIFIQAFHEIFFMFTYGGRDVRLQVMSGSEIKEFMLKSDWFMFVEINDDGVVAMSDTVPLGFGEHLEVKQNHHVIG